MRTLFLSLLCLFGALTVLQAQDSSYGIAYQAVARDADGDPLADVALGVRVTLRDADGNSIWQEEHASVLTNSFGNVALTIGSGTAAPGQGSLGDIDWSASGLHFEIEVDAGAGYASFGDVDVQAVPVALYAAGGWEGDVEALYEAIDQVDGDLTTFIGEANAALSTLQGDVAANASAISTEAQTRADEDAALLGLIQANDGEIAILQSSVASNTADLGDILTVFTFNGNTATIGAEGTLIIDGTLDLSGGSFSAGTGLFNYLSASNADFEEMSAESGLFEDLRFFNGRGFGPDSHLDLDGTLNVDGDATFNGSVSGTDGELASQNYVDAAVAAEATARANADATIQADVDQNELDSDAADNQLQLNINAVQADVDQNEIDSDAADNQLQLNINAVQADVDQNEIDSDNADDQLQQNINAEATARANADNLIQADVDQNELDSDAADNQLQLNINAVQADVDQNELDSDAADNQLQLNINAVQADVDQNELDSDAADADLQGQINDNEFRIGAAAADMGFVTTTVGGVDNTPAHPGYDGTNYLDGESTLVGADEALDAALKAEADRAMAAEGQNAANISQNASDIAANLSAIQSNDGDISDLQTALQNEITRATTAEGNIQADVDQNEIDSDNADDQLQQNINAEATARANADSAIQSDVDQNELDSDAADNQLQLNINAEATARADADILIQQDVDQNEADSDSADAALQGQIDSNDIEIADLQSGLQTEINQRILAQGIMNTAIQNNQGAINAEATTRANEDDILLELINELQGDVVNDGPIDAYFNHSGSTVTFNNGMYTNIDMNAADLNDVGAASFDEVDAQYLDVDNADIQNLTVESNLYGVNGTFSDQLSTQDLTVWNDLNVEGDLSVAGAVDFDSTLTVAGETTLNDNTVINGDLTVNGNVTAFEATMNSHLPTYGQVTYIADTLQDNIDDEEAARIAADNLLQEEIDRIEAGAGLDTDGNYVANSGSNYIDAATSLDHADDLLDAALKAEEGARIAADNALNGRADSLATAVAGNDSDITALQNADIALNGRADSLATAVAGNDSDITALQNADIALNGRADSLATAVAGNDSDIIALNGRADSLATAVAGNDQDIIDLQSELDNSQSGAGLATNGDYNSNSGTNYIDAATSLDNADDLLDAALKVEEGARIAADITISDSLQQNIIDEMNRAMTREAELQTELDNTQTGAGLNADGSYTASSARWIDDATSLTNADDQLAAAADSIEQVLYWNKEEAPGNDNWQLVPDDDIDRVYMPGVNVLAHSFSAAAAVSGNQGSFEYLNADEAQLEEIQSLSIIAGVVDTDEIFWGDAEDNGPASTTYLHGTLTVDSITTLNGYTDINDSLHVEDLARFEDDVYVAGNVYVTGDIYVDDVYGDSLDFNFGEIDKLATDTITNVTGAGLVLNAIASDIRLHGDSVVANTGIFANSTLDVDGATTLNSTLDVDGLTTLNDSLHVTGGADFDSNVNIDGNLNVDGISTVDSLNAAEGVYFASTLEVDGVTDLDDSLHVALNADFDSNLNVDGITTVDSLNAADGVYFQSTLEVNGITELNDSLHVDKNADFDMNVNIDGDLIVDGTTIVDSLNAAEGVYFESTLEVDGITELNDSLHVDKNADFDMNVNVDGNLNVDGVSTVDSLNAAEGVYFESTLEVDGITELNDSLHVDKNADFDMNVNVDGNLNVDGISTVDSLNAAEGVYFESTLEVDGITELNDSLHVDKNADFDMNVNVDGNLNVDGVSTVDSLNAAEGVYFESTLEVDGITELNDSLHVDKNADFDMNVNVDGNLNVDGVSTVDSLNAAEGVYFESTLEVDGITDLNDSLHVDKNVDFDMALNVDGHTELNDSLHVDKSVGIDMNLWVGGNTDITGMLHVVDSAQFDDNVNIDATLTADSVVVEESIKIYTPTYDGYGFTNEILSEPELEVLNVDGDPIFEVDGHNDDVIAENLTVNGTFTTQDWIVNDDISCDDLSAAGVVTAGNNTYGSEWATATQNQNNWLTRRDYVDFHRQAATGVLQAFSYDADLISTSNGDTDYNGSVYYMDGDLVLYADSVDASDKNYVITVMGTNFNSLVDEDGAPLTIEAAIWAENNELAITAASHGLAVVDDNTITFEIGYDDINGIVACTSGKVRPTLALGSATYGMQMTGLHFFIELEEAPAAP